MSTRGVHAGFHRLVLVRRNPRKPGP